MVEVSALANDRSLEFQRSPAMGQMTKKGLPVMGMLPVKLCYRFLVLLSLGLRFLSLLVLQVLLFRRSLFVGIKIIFLLRRISTLVWSRWR
jgi:hypothetical protein